MPQTGNPHQLITVPQLPPHHLIQRLGQRSSGFMDHQLAPGVEACDSVVGTE